jgi:hypothetical protein
MSSNQLEAACYHKYVGTPKTLDILVTSGLLPVTLSKENFSCGYFRNKCSISPIPCGVILVSSVKQ